MKVLEQAKALELEARQQLGKIPMMAKAMYPEYVASAEQFCDKLMILVRDLEKIEKSAG